MPHNAHLFHMLTAYLQGILEKQEAKMQSMAKQLRTQRANPAPQIDVSYYLVRIIPMIRSVHANFCDDKLNIIL